MCVHTKFRNGMVGFNESSRTFQLGTRNIWGPLHEILLTEAVAYFGETGNSYAGLHKY